MDAQSTYKEGRIALAIQAHKDGYFTSLRAAADAYDIPESTLRYCVKGGRAQKGLQAMNTKLSTIEEEALIKWILSIDERGLPVRKSPMRAGLNYMDKLDFLTAYVLARNNSIASDTVRNGLQLLVWYYLT